jgi:Ca2+-binding RTX toxin-like protein
VRDLFYVLQRQTGLAFSEVTGDTGDLRFGINQQANTRGYSFLPDEYKGDAKAGDVWLDQETVVLMSPGQEGYYVLLHEIAHALGLQHPLSEANTSGATVLLNAFATTSNTVMLDVSASTVNGSWPAWYGSFDLQALRALYGTRSYAAGNDVYTISDISNSMTIIDDGGIDTLEASTSSLSANIDLRGGKTSSIGMETDGTAKFSNVAIASGSLIENVTGTAYDDVIIGNSQNNVITFVGGNDIVDGQAGMDTLRLWNTAAEFKIAKDTSSGYWNVEAINNSTGSIELQNLERIYFADKAWALDMGTNENAGRTAKILGALFGKEGLSYPSFRGIGLYFLDSGVSYEALMGAAVDTRLWPGASKADVANVLMANVPGLVLDPNAYANTTAMAVAAADSELNKSMINLVGLATTGFDYIILG